MNGFDAGAKWERWRETSERAWTGLLDDLKKYCEARAGEPAGDPHLGGTYLQEAVLQNRRIS
jgi:hypothetical protein